MHKPYLIKCERHDKLWHNPFKLRSRQSPAKIWSTKDKYEPPRSPYRG